MSNFRIALLTEQDGRQIHVHAAVLLHARTSAELARKVQRIQLLRRGVMDFDKENWTYEQVIDCLNDSGFCVAEVISLSEEEAKEAKSSYADWPPGQRAEEW